jgi:HdeA/HdeB family
MVSISQRMLITVAVLAGAFVAVPALAQVQTERAIEQFTCKDVMRDPGSNREIAIAFLHGYLLGKSGTSKFNVEVLEKQTDAFIDGCLDHPQDKAQDVMSRVKK